jgi:tetratricopeptide (TPR) repeat protein
MRFSQRVLCWLALCCAACLCWGVGAQAAAWEKVVLVLPLKAADQESQNVSWFGWAFRDGLAQAFLSFNTAVFLKDDELASVFKEYKLKPQQDAEPGQLEKIADDKEIAIISGSFSRHQGKITIHGQVIPGRSEEAHAFTVTGSDTQLRALFGQVLKESTDLLDLKPNENAQELRFVPGTDSWAALEAYTQAQQNRRAGGNNGETPSSRLAQTALLDKALAHDPEFVSAQAQRLTLRLSKPGLEEKDRKLLVAAAEKETATAAQLEPGNPYLESVRLELLLLQQKYVDAIALGTACVKTHATNYRNYLFLGRAYQGAGRENEAEKILMKALEQQGTPLQKKPFNLELGLLLLNHKDKLAENFLHEVIQLEPNNASLHYWRGLALFNLGRWLDVMDEIQAAEAIHQSNDLKLLKAKTTLALGNDYLKSNDLDRAYTFTTMAAKLRPRHFETSLLFARVLRKKGYLEEAHKQLDAARQIVDNQRARDHFLLGTEYIAQGYKEEGAQEYVTYLKLNPQAPERSQLIQYIRKLRGAGGDE